MTVLEAVRRLVPAVNLIEVEIENPGGDGWYGGLRSVAGVESAEMHGQVVAWGWST